MATERADARAGSAVARPTRKDYAQGMTATDAFRAARDQLIDLREDQERAVAEFAFPDVGERFNWAIDWFDAIARGNDAPALVIVEEDGSSTELSFDAIAARSDRSRPG